MEAETLYTRALHALPINHDHRILLSNNRAAARLKAGNYEACLRDCNVAIEMAERRGEGHCVSGEKEVSWQEQVVKALLRKAEALEALLRHKEAIQVYETLIAYQGNSSPRISQGISKCRAAMEMADSFSPGHSHATPSGYTAPKPPVQTAFPDIDYSIFENFKPAPAAPPSKGVAAMREMAAQKEAEGLEKLEKADRVDARLKTWKDTRELNLRALLASLDMVVWEELGWQRVEIGELIDPKKCKTYYRKAIAKVHPDKLPINASVEQQMLASGIFSVLNEAWDSFKTQNQL
ncbi:DnaJ domain-containing protein [Phycomyces nitens]|nr:DnaJ domain-containing protein [Phycomyces nitens]